MSVEKLQQSAERYQILSVLQTTRSSFVYLAEDVAHGRYENGKPKRLVIIKEARTIYTYSLNAVQSLLDWKSEAAIHQHFSDLFPNNVPRYIDFQIVNGLPRIIMEACDGKSYQDLLFGQDEGLPIERVIRLTKLAAIIDAWNNMGLYHRDIKPGNIMENGEHDVILDFGLLSAKSSEEVVAGTAYFVPPEVFEDGTRIEGSDRYAFAVLLYMMLCGELPYALEEPNYDTNGKQIDLDHPTRISDHPVFLEKALRAGIDPTASDPLFEKQFSKLPHQRFQTAQEFAQALVIALTSRGKR